MAQTATTPTTPNRLLRIVLAPAHWLERARGRRRIALVLLYGLVLLPVGVLAWRELGLVGLPDVGDPFDVAAFEAVSVPDDENAFVLYREAAAKLRPLKEAQRPSGSAPSNGYEWAQAPPEVRAWLEGNAEALELWRRGTERPRVLDIPPREVRFDSKVATLDALREFARLAKLEGTRREAGKDMAGAYAMYRPILLASRHADLQGLLIGRLIGAGTFAIASAEVGRWAEDPRVDARLLRGALADAQVLRETAAPNSLAFRYEYLLALHGLRDPDDRVKLLTWNEEPPAWYETFAFYRPARLWLSHEPERSLRVCRLFAANRLAYCDLPRDERPTRSRPLGFYQPAPGIPAPPAAHALPSDQLDAWLRSAPLAMLIEPGIENAQVAMDRRHHQHDTLILTLAAELYRREHGQPPKTYGDLLGPDLESLPPGYDPADRY